MKPIVIFGAAGQAKVAIEAIEQIGTHRIAGFIAHGDLGFTSSYPVLGSDDDVKRLWEEMGGFDGHIAVGDVAIRRRIADRLARDVPAMMFPPVVHPLARLAKNAVIAPGAFVAIGATVCADARVGLHAIVNTNASIDHDCVLGDYAFVGPNAALGGTVIVGDGAFIGLGAAVLPNLRIGANAIVGGGAVVVRDVTDGTTVVGVPARARE
jgi:sugar O-acyltransferase (sialic acid O-acetyltransferase NeuD family)